MACSTSQTVLFSVLLLLSLHEACAKQTHLHFYFHEITSGSNATVMTVVKAPGSDSFTYGAISVVDDMLREGQDDNSTLIGRAQGLGAVVGKDDNSILTMINLVFTEGEYNGSSLAIYGRVVRGTTTERPVIGGTGMFRNTLGYCLGTPLISSDTKVVYEFNVYVWHLD